VLLASAVQPVDLTACARHDQSNTYLAIIECGVLLSDNDERVSTIYSEFFGRAVEVFKVRPSTLDTLRYLFTLMRYGSPQPTPPVRSCTRVSAWMPRAHFPDIRTQPPTSANVLPHRRTRWPCIFTAASGSRALGSSRPLATASRVLSALRGLRVRCAAFWRATLTIHQCNAGPARF
jgi:hypothetical protein